MKRDELAAYFGMDITNVSKWEKGNHVPKVPDLIRIAHYFDVTIDDLLLKNLESVGKSLASTGNVAHEKNETYAAKSEQNAQEIHALQIRVSALEAWKVVVDKSLNL